MALAGLQRTDADDLPRDLLALLVGDRHDDAVLASSLAARVMNRAFEAHCRDPAGCGSALCRH